MDTFGLDGIILHQFVFALLPFGRIGDCLDFRKLRGNVGQDEELRVACLAGEFVDTFVCQFDASVFFVDDKVEGIGYSRHFATVVLKVVGLGLEKDVLHAFLAEKFDQGAVFRQTFVGSEQQQGTFFFLLFVL